VAEADHHIEIGWTRDAADGGAHGSETVHDRDEILFHIGGDMNNPLDLGGTLELFLGGQSITTSKTSGLWVPKGLRHGPFTDKKVEKPYLRMAFLVGERR
jgi:hypothetical protein